MEKESHGPMYNAMDHFDLLERILDEEGNASFQNRAKLWGTIYPMMTSPENGTSMDPDPDKGACYKIALYRADPALFKKKSVHTIKWGKKYLTILRAITWPSGWVDLVVKDEGCGD